MIWLCLIALLAFTVEGAIGFGGTVIVVSLGAHLLPLEMLLPAFVPISMCFSISLLRRNSIEWRILLAEIVPIVAIGAAGGLALSRLIGGRELLLAFACFVIALSLLQLVRPETGTLARGWRAALLATGGIVHGLFGTGGPMIVYVTRRRISDKTRFRSTLAVLWIALNLALIASFASRAHYPTPSTMLVLAAAVVPGLVLGDRLHRALDARRFERAVWIVLLVAGLSLALRTIVV